MQVLYGVSYRCWGKTKCTRILKIFIKNFKRVRNVQKSMETSGDLYPLECTQDHSARDLGLLILKEMCSLVPRPILDIKWQMGLGTRLRNVMGQCTERSPLVSMLF